METETTSSTIWQKSRVLIKGLIIMMITFLLLIPTISIQHIIEEREKRQEEAFNEVSGRWAGKQQITGPVLVIPYRDTSTGVKRLAYILPDQLDIQSTVTPEERHRGIFQVLLYSASIKLSGRFNKIPLAALRIDPADVYWKEAYVCLGLADAKGLREEMRLNWNGSPLVLDPTKTDNALLKEGFMAPVSLSADAPIIFDGNIRINGSEQLLFTPVGKETRVEISSKWPHPSFTGGILPEHQLSDGGFVATWKSLAHTRNFPQAWKDVGYDLQSAAFGTDLFIPVNGYQKTMRSVKYAILCILLTFAAFFIMESISRRSVHPLQYALVGLALVLFYTLLLSFSEYIGFNLAYAVAAIATISLISWFIRDVLGSMKQTAVMSLVLVAVYAYVFTTLQIQDYSLLLGSVGLFFALAVIMRFSKKIQW